jgi:ParB-like chromosome segregation protein Spo0J
MEVRKVPIESLSPDPANARKHPDRNIEQIVASLRRFGQQKPIVVDQKSVVRAGNGTLEAAKRLGWAEIAVVVSDLPLSELTAYAVVDNRTAELAEWDKDILAGVLSDPDIGDLGFNEDEIGKLTSPPVEAPDDFATVDESIETEHQCPKCGYRWSGSSAADGGSDV